MCTWAVLRVRTRAANASVVRTVALLVYEILCPAHLFCLFSYPPSPPRGDHVPAAICTSPPCGAESDVLVDNIVFQNAMSLSALVDKFSCGVTTHKIMKCEIILRVCGQCIAWQLNGTTKLQNDG